MLSGVHLVPCESVSECYHQTLVQIASCMAKSSNICFVPTFHEFVAVMTALTAINIHYHHVLASSSSHNLEYFEYLLEMSGTIDVALAHAATAIV